jgi:(2Fe-2S) ferredoxin
MKEQGKKCCGQSHAVELADDLSQKLKQAGLWGPGKFRVTKSKCLGRCDQGPCTVIYPEGLWLQLMSTEDVDTLVEEYLEKGKPIKKLQILQKKQ